METVFTVLASFSEALAEGAAMLPNLMFVGLFYQHYGELSYILPFVLLYAFEKAGVFLLSGFGRLKNPCAVWFWGNIAAAFGCMLIFFGSESNPFWNAGAILIGLGLSCFSPVYRTARDALKERKLWKQEMSLLLGYLVLGLYILFVMFQRRVHMPLVVAGILLLILISTVHCILISAHSPYRKAPVFEKKTARKEQFVYAGIMLLFTFLVRLYKQTASVRLVAGVVLGLLLMLAAVMFFRREAFRPWSLRTLWYGAERNFVTIFSLIYFTAIGDPGKVTMAYLMIAVGVALSKAAESVLRKKVPEAYFERFCVAAACVSSCLTLLPFTACYMAGVLLTVLFVSMGNAASLKSYLADERFPAEEKRLIRARFYGLGAVLEHAFLLLILFVASKLIRGDGTVALEEYAFQSGSAANAAVFAVTLPACIAINALWAWMFTGRRKKEKDLKQE